MKNLLMIIPFFPPNAGGGVYRPLGFVRYLERYGWRPTVIAPAADSFWIRDDSLLADVPACVRVHRTGTLSGQSILRRMRGNPSQSTSQVRSSRGFGLLRRMGAAMLLPDTYIGWYPFAVRQGKHLLAGGSFEAIYSTSPPETTHLIGLALRRWSDLPWVADFRDPWMNLHLLPTPTALHRRIHQSLERRVCENASLVVTNRWHEELLRGKYPGLRSLTVIRNGYDHNKLDLHAGEQPPTDVFHILHAGMLTQKRTAIPFLEAVRTLIDRRPELRQVLRATFVGPRESENEEHVANLGLQDMVVFRDTVPHAESLKLERRSHILLLIKHQNPVYQGLIPGKLFEYIGARRPILALVPEGEVAEIVREQRRGEVVGLESTNEIAVRLELMYERFREGTLDSHYDLSEVDAYKRETQAGALARVLNEAAGGAV